MKAPTDRLPVPVSDALRAAIIESRLSYKELSRRTGLDQGQLSRYVAGTRDLTVTGASQLCLVLGYELARTGPMLEKLPPGVVFSTRRRKLEGLPPPEGSEKRGQGRRMDLELEREESPPAGKQSRGGKRRPS
jgi:transcriptional regulator with XRE-family HTH domain